ncbi:MAG: hypothetical protein A2Y97_10415 [Nitrospirae bacterium RBG_13_39_12]|nr:MAG: hypothetical protein A2Y97_10415 [Nitrospirae bacterium RBG_13_39_12]
MKNIKHRKIVSELFYAALKAVDPYESVKKYAGRILLEYKTYKCKKILVVGFGKTACQMAKSIEAYANKMIDTGVVITKYGHCPSSYKSKKIKVFEGGHPVPDRNGFKGTEDAIRLLKKLKEDTLIVFLISGGGSALLVSPCDDILLDEKQKITKLLLNAGANIQELNTVRKHISKVKGGRLAEISYPARIISLILSDVISDRLDVIASGPTSPDKTEYKDAIAILKKYKLINSTPKSILKHLNNGVKDIIPETPKEGDTIFKKVDNIIIGSNKIALETAKNRAKDFGLQASIISSKIIGEASEVGKWLAKKALEKKRSASHDRPICLISGGETTVTVKGNGVGGRNMELALSFALKINGTEGITLLSAGTDGTDGPTDAAGAIVDGQTVLKAKTMGIDPQLYLKNNDSYSFFKKVDELFITGPTGTNVMDIQAVRIE